MTIKQKAPRCPRCGGILIPEHDLSGLTTSVGCTLCGDRKFRGVKGQAPKQAPREICKGVPTSYGGVRI